VSVARRPPDASHRTAQELKPPIVTALYTTATPGVFRINTIAYLTSNATLYPFPQGTKMQDIDGFCTFVNYERTVIDDYVYADGFGQ